MIKPILKLINILLYITILMLLVPLPADASGFFANNIFVQSVPTESRAVIVYDGRKETIFDSVTFNINPVIAWNFYWILAVPQEPKVELVIDELLTKFDTLTKKDFEKNNITDKLLYFDTNVEKEVPASIYSRPVDFVNYKVFGPESSLADLDNFLAEGGYIIPKTAKHILQEYHDKKWYFIAAEVNANHLQQTASESLTIPGAHTFPIKIEFETDNIIYPLKLASVQPDYDSESIALNYDYGTSSDAVLGAKDEKVDDMLSIQSKNKYPRLPLDYTYMKVDLFILSDSKVQSDGFTTVWAGKSDKAADNFSDLGNKKYYDLPKKSTYLTRLVAFKPMLQLEDVHITKANDNNFVNTKPPMNVQLFKLVILLVVPTVLILLILKKKYVRK